MVKLLCWAISSPRSQVSEASVDVDNDRFDLLAAMTAYTNLSYAKSLTEAVKLG